MSFVRLDNLNDFINPSSACVKPLDKKPAKGIVTKVNEVSLSDCLACSGCITSAESVLVQQQNYDELFRIINDNKTSKDSKLIVVSLSLQSIASLAHKFKLEIQDAAERLASFFVSIGCDRVYDINLARHLALVESYREFQQRRDGTQPKLPILSSACPGWICYVEKTNGDLVIPHLSQVRSPQQIMGSLVKRILLSKEGRRSESIYHVTVMPCFDKKLEASRKEFSNSLTDCRDVDCVLTPIEIEEILKNEDASLGEFARKKLDILTETGYQFDSPLTSHLGSASGGYAESILLAEASKSLLLSNKSEDTNKLKDINIEYTQLRNDDFIELSLKDKQSNMPKVAIVNGFRNIQTVVQRLKRNALKYDYIEVMACPSGCINGGAQCRQDGKPEVYISATKDLYASVSPVELAINDDESSQRLYSKLDLNSPENGDLLRTSFQAVPKMQSLTVNW